MAKRRRRGLRRSRPFKFRRRKRGRIQRKYYVSRGGIRL
jgi:hypothetical protein